MVALTTTFPAQAMTSTAASACRRRLAQDSIGVVVFAVGGSNVSALVERGMR
jgi:hypothetical protein